MESYIVFIEKPSYLTLLIMVIFDVNILFSIIPGIAICLVGFIEWFTTSYYLKHKYLEIYHKIALSVKYDNKRLLMAAIVEHHYWERQVRDCNHTFKWWTFIIRILHWYCGDAIICVYII